MKPLMIGVAALLTLMLSGACGKEEVNATKDYVVFGRFYGECHGERCIEMYKLDLKKEKLQEDKRDRYPSHTTPYDGNFINRPKSLYQQVKELPNAIPAQLYQESRVIGQPDAGDWGGYYLEVTRNGDQRFWLIDKSKGNLPAYLHSFVDELEESIEKLK